MLIRRSLSCSHSHTWSSKGWCLVSGFSEVISIVTLSRHFWLVLDCQWSTLNQQQCHTCPYLKTKKVWKTRKRNLCKVWRRWKSWLDKGPAFKNLQAKDWSGQVQMSSLRERHISLGKHLQPHSLSTQDFVERKRLHDTHLRNSNLVLLTNLLKKRPKTNLTTFRQLQLLLLCLHMKL